MSRSRRETGCSGVFGGFKWLRPAERPRKEGSSNGTGTAGRGKQGLGT